MKKKHTDFKTSKTTSTKGGSVASYFNRVVGLNGNAGKVSFYQPIGSEVNGNFFAGDATSGIKSVPGIMKIKFAPGPGYSTDINSSVNVASLGILAYLTSSIGRPYSYDAPDYMQYILAYESPILHLARLSNAIGACKLVSGENRYWGELVIKALGFDPSIRGDQANARFLFNYYANQLSKLNVPKTFTNIDWHLHLMSKIYRDQDNLKAQLYILQPEVYYIYDEAGVGNGPRLVANKYSDGMTLAQWTTIMDNMLSVLLASQSIANMSSDTKKAFGDNLYTVPRIDDSYIIEVTKDEEILNFIHNITLVGEIGSISATLPVAVDLESFNVTQDPTTTALLWEPIVKVNNIQLAGQYSSIIESTLVLDMPYDNPTEDEVLVATRGKAIVKVNSQSEADVIAAGTELYTQAVIYNTLPDIHGFTTYVSRTYSVPNDGGTNLSKLFNMLTYWGVFDWAPKIAVYIVDSNTLVPQAVGQLWETNNYLQLDLAILTRINNGAMASVYNIPEIGIIK